MMCNQLRVSGCSARVRLDTGSDSLDRSLSARCPLLDCPLSVRCTLPPSEDRTHSSSSLRSCSCLLASTVGHESSDSLYAFHSGVLSMRADV